MRRFLVFATLLSLLLVALPGNVAAAPATKTTENAVVLSCELATADGYLSLYAAVSSEFGAFGDLAIWTEPAVPYTDVPTIVTSMANVSGGSTSMTATFELAEFDESADPPYGADAGTAELEVDFTPDGDPSVVDDRFRNGNHTESVKGTSQPLLVAGSLTLPDEVITDLSSCYAADQHLTYFSTNPSAYNDRFREFFVQCGWEIDDGFVSLFARSDPFGAYGDVYLSMPGGDIGGFGDATLTETALALAVDLEDFTLGGVVGSAEATANLASSGMTTRTVETFGRERIKIIAESFAVDGAMDVTLGGSTTTYPMNDETCFAADQRVAIHSVRPNGPKAGPLANDTPAGALTAKLGRTIRIVTGGNAFEPEAPCTTTYPGGSEEVDVPIAYTAWWTATGTGAGMSADTAGSEFDTVVGVFVMGAGGLVQVTCVDDVADPVFSLQARAEWASVAGTTYYLQVGGFGGSAGRLQLVVR